MASGSRFARRQALSKSLTLPKGVLRPEESGLLQPGARTEPDSLPARQHSSNHRGVRGRGTPRALAGGWGRTLSLWVGVTIEGSRVTILLDGNN